MAQQDGERSPIGRTALGGASCGFTYDAALQDAVAREQRLRRPLRASGWQAALRVGPSAAVRRAPAEPARSDLPA